MTKEQEKVVETYKEQYAKNLADYSNYGSYNVSTFGVYANDTDKNITIIFCNVVDLTEFLQPLTKVSNILVEPNGSSFPLSEAFDEQLVLDYIQKLKKID